MVEQYVTDDTRGGEIVPQPPSFEIPHADRVITAHGITGAIGSLINFCPVPAEDKANWTQEKVDNYVQQLIAMDESQKEEPETEEPENEEGLELEKAKKTEVDKKDKVEQKKETKEPEKKADTSRHGKLVVSEKEPHEVEQTSVQTILNQGVVQSTNPLTKIEKADEALSAGTDVSSARLVTAARPEKIDVVSPAQETRTTSSPVLESPQKVSETAISTIMEPKSPKEAQINTAEVETSSPPSQKLEIDTRSANLDEPPKRFDAFSPAQQEVESVDLPLSAEPDDEGSSSVGEEYQLPTFEVETNFTDSEQEEWMVENSKPGALYSLDDFQNPPNVLVLDQPQQKTIREDFSLPIAETHDFDLPEYARDASITAPKLDMLVKEAEQAVNELAECIEELGSKETETVHRLLDEIVLKAEEARTTAEINVENQEDSLQAEEVKKELKELFIELFDYVEMEYTPELIESFVKLASYEDISALILGLEQEETANVSCDRGLHEVIKHLLTVIARIKKAVFQAYHLGKSAIQLYSQQLVTVSGI